MGQLHWTGHKGSTFKQLDGSKLKIMDQLR